MQPIMERRHTELQNPGFKPPPFTPQSVIHIFKKIIDVCTYTITHAFVQIQTHNLKENVSTY
jgi:hypothetical protein